MSEEVKEIAARIRELREICGFSIESISEKIGVSVAKYSEFEESGIDIPISVLYELANIFGVDMTEIITGVSPKMDTYCIVRKDNGIDVNRYPGYKIQSIAYNYINRKMEPMIVTVEPDESGSHSALVTHPGQEMNYILEGVVRLTLGKKDYILNEGDTIYFNPNIPHRQQAVGDKTSKFLTVILDDSSNIKQLNN